MKRLITFIATLFFAEYAVAQHRVFAPEIGLNFSKIHGKYGDVTYNSKSKTGLRLGFILDGKLSDHMHLQPGLFYSQLGGKNSYYAVGYSSFQQQKLILNISYLQLPATLIYKFSIKKVLGRFFFGAGPYIGYAISGTYKEGTASVKLKFGDDKGESDVKHFDYGLDVKTGYELPFGLYAKLAYQRGLVNIDPYAEGKETADHKAISFSIGYFIGSNKQGTTSGQK